MGRAIDALIEGAASAIDLSGPPAPASKPPEAAIHAYWNAAGAYLWHGVEAYRPLYEMQQPLFDAAAFPARR